MLLLWMRSEDSWKSTPRQGDLRAVHNQELPYFWDMYLKGLTPKYRRGDRKCFGAHTGGFAVLEHSLTNGYTHQSLP